jgi:hypothetical protein
VAQKSQKKDSLSALSLNENSLQKEYQIPSPRNAQPSQNLISEAVAHNDDNIASGLVGQVDSSHWSSILENIRAIRDELPDASPQTSTLSSVTLNNEVSTSEADFDMGSPDGLSIEHILSALPPRQVCDTLVSVFFLSHYTMMRKLV